MRFLPMLLPVGLMLLTVGCSEVVYRCLDSQQDSVVADSFESDQPIVDADDETLPPVDAGSEIMADSSYLDVTADIVDEGVDTGPVEPTYFSAGATIVNDSDRYVTVDGNRFFALGVHASPSRQYDGITGPGLCDKDTGVGYIDINVTKTHRAADEGANFVYLWGYDERTRELLDVTPRFHGIFHSGYGTAIPAEDDVVPIVYNAFGEEDMEGYDEERIAEMAAEFNKFITRTGRFSIESMPNLPPVSQVGHLSWHPTFRMSGGGDGKGEVLTDEQAAEFAKTRT